MKFQNPSINYNMKSFKLLLLVFIINLISIEEVSSQSFLSGDEAHFFIEYENNLYFESLREVKFINAQNDIITLSGIETTNTSTAKLYHLDNVLYASSLGKLYRIINGNSMLIADYSPNFINKLTLYNNELIALITEENGGPSSLKKVSNNSSFNFPFAVFHPHLLNYNGVLYIQFSKSPFSSNDELWKFDGVNLSFVSSQFLLKEGNFPIQKLGNYIIGVDKNKRLVAFNGINVTFISQNVQDTIHHDDTFGFNRAIIFNDKFIIGERIKQRLRVIDFNLNQSFFTPTNNENIYSLRILNGEFYCLSLSNANSKLTKLNFNGINITENVIVTFDIAGSGTGFLNYYQNSIIYIHLDGQLRMHGDILPKTCFDVGEEFGGTGNIIGIKGANVYMNGFSQQYGPGIYKYPQDPSEGLCNQNTDFSISGITYEDINNNGVKENNEPAIPGVTVLFTNGSGSISDIDGNYSLANQQTGIYIIKAIAPLGYSANLPINGETTISLPYNGASINFGFKKDCPHPDYIALRDLYNATNGSQWTNTITGDNPWLVDCDPCGLIDGTPWKGIQCTNMGRVDVINLNNNNLMGTLPASIGQLSELEWFNVNRNILSGSLPSEICNLNKMLHFVVSNNMFSGNFPACFANLTSLSRIVANNNKFTGALPILGGNTQPSLINLHFDNNMFNGSIPSNYGNLPNLNYLAVANNDLSGCYPQVLSIFCSDPDFTSNTNALISDGNSFNASWSQFCATGAGSCTVSISDQDFSNITVYPNPVSNQLFINIIGIKSSFNFKVYDNTGREYELKSTDLQNGINSLDVSLLPAGIYFLRIGTNELQKFTKFIKID